MSAAGRLAGVGRVGSVRVATDTAIGVLAVIVVWQLAAVFGLGGRGAVPTPMSVLQAFITGLGDPRYWASIQITGYEAVYGFVWGNVIALALTAVVFLIPWFEGVSMQVAVIASCIPHTAIAPLIVLMSPQSSRLACVVLAAMSVFFTTMIGALVGLRAADKTAIDLVRAYGGNSWTELLKVRLRAALPSIMSALCIGVPAAFVGAILGELFLSGADTGLGIMIMAAQIAFQPQQLWALALLSAAVAGVAYGVMRLVTRLATPWDSGTMSLVAPRAGAERSSLQRLGITVATLVASAALLLVVWQVLVTVLPVNRYVARTPLQVLEYLTTDPQVGDGTAADIRAELWQQLLVTGRDSVIGFLVGMVGAVLLSVLFFLLPRLQTAFMPTAMLMRTVPLVGFAPIIYLVFGNGAVTIGLIGAIIVFFPVLINMASGFAQTSSQSLDLVSVYGGSRWTTLRKVAFPTALPQLFASIKISVPGAIVAAMLYEWLFSLDGLGGAITKANTDALYAETWAIVIAVTGVSIIVYNIVELIEIPVLAAWGPEAGRKAR